MYSGWRSTAQAARGALAARGDGFLVEEPAVVLTASRLSGRVRRRGTASARSGTSSPVSKINGETVDSAAVGRSPP